MRSNNWRVNVIYLFILVILTGVPMWWKTTEVYRPYLPIDEINDFTNSHKVTSTPTKFVYTVVSRNRIAPESVEILETAGQQDLEATRDLVTKIVGNLSTGFYHVVILHDESYKDYLTVGSNRCMWFHTSSLSAENLSKILQAVSVVSDVNFADNVDLSSNREDTEMIQIKHAKSYHLSFVLCNANTQAINGWDFDKAFSQYFSSMIRKLSLISKFEVDSQVVHFTEVEKKPIFDAKEKHYYFTKQTLPYFLQSNSWNLDFVADTKPILHFVLYIPNNAYTPLYIKYPDGSLSSTGSFLIPQWGGIVILPNLENTTNSPQTFTLNRDIIEIFVGQLREFLSIPSPHEKEAAILSAFKKLSLPFRVEILTDGESGITDWEVDMVMFHRLRSAQQNAVGTIAKFVDLIQHLTNIPIQDRLVGLIMSTLDSLNQVAQCAAKMDYQGAYNWASNAVESAETAFFDSETMGLLYFPDEHKPAIYLPFFLPLTFPLFGTLKREYKRWKERKSKPKKVQPQYLAPPNTIQNT